MNFSLSTSAPKKVPAHECTVQDLLNIQDELHLAYEALTPELKNIDEVRQIVDNIDFSMTAISKYGNNAVKILNVDGSLEALLGIPEKMITAEKAMEGLGDAARDAWETFKQWVRSIVEKFKALFSKFADWIAKKSSYAQSLKSKISSLESSNSEMNNKIKKYRSSIFELAKKLDESKNAAVNQNDKIEKLKKAIKIVQSGPLTVDQAQNMKIMDDVRYMGDVPQKRLAQKLDPVFKALPTDDAIKNAFKPVSDLVKKIVEQSVDPNGGLKELDSLIDSTAKNIVEMFHGCDEIIKVRRAFGDRFFVVEINKELIKESLAESSFGSNMVTREYKDVLAEGGYSNFDDIKNTIKGILDFNIRYSNDGRNRPTDPADAIGSLLDIDGRLGAEDDRARQLAGLHKILQRAYTFSIHVSNLSFHVREDICFKYGFSTWKHLAGYVVKCEKRVNNMNKDIISTLHLN